MKTRNFVLLCSLVVALGALFAVTEVRANPPGVPLTEPGPSTCNTTNFTIAAIPGINGEFPIMKPCSSLNPTKTCADYGYTITKKNHANVDHAIFALSADQDLDSAFGNGTSAVTTQVFSPGQIESLTGFLAYADHEYAIRFDSTDNPSIEAHIFIVGLSAPRLSTVLVRAGTTITEHCSIAGPGVAGDLFRPQTATQDVNCAGGKCTCRLSFDTAGNIFAVTSPDCQVDTPASLTIGGKPVTFFGQEGITIGTGTTSCYPTKPTATCVCLLKPC